MSERFVCSRCSADQDRAVAGQLGRCAVCGASLSEAATGGNSRSTEIPVDLPGEQPEFESPELDLVRTGQQRAARIARAIPWVALAVMIGGIVWVVVSPPEKRNLPEEADLESRIRDLVELVVAYQRDFGALPDTSTWEQSADGSDPRFVDPWGRRFVYEATPKGFRVGTYGADGEPGGTGEGRDVFVSRP